MGSSEPSNLTIRVLQEITDNFSQKHMIGHGSYGKVYRGVHEDGQEIAIKMLYNDRPGIDDEQFQHEFDNLVKLKHKNIVRLVGYCYDTQREHQEFEGKTVFGEKTHRALCFEYLHNGTLQKHLSDECHGLEWHIRYNIIKGICEGLKYLHEGFENPIYHLDLKPDNILLDENLEPKLADFGLSKLFGDEQTKITQSPVGTLGYLPMEYLHGNVISKKFDIFSLGVVMTKIITGPGGHTKSAETPYGEFVHLVHENWRNRFQETLPASWPLEAYCQQVTTCTEIALSCMDTDRHKRPSIVDIIQKLNETETVVDEFKLDAGSPNDKVMVQAFTRNQAIPGADMCSGFPVLVRVTAAPWHRAEKMPRAGVDVVAIIDTSISMCGESERCMRQAMMTVIDKLDHKDRLSVVTFKGIQVIRRLGLTYMSERGRDTARGDITLITTGRAQYTGPSWMKPKHNLRKPQIPNDVGAAFGEGAEILRGRELKEGDSRLGCIMYLSAGATRTIFREEISPEFPVHAFGLGIYHDPLVMRYITDRTSGTYSFIEDGIDKTSEAFAVFTSGITSIAATSVKITLRAHEGVAISSIESGRHGNAASSNKGSGHIDIDNMYAGEQKNFIVYLTLVAKETMEDKEKLLTVGGQYQSLGASKLKELASTDTFVLRRPPGDCLPGELAIHPEVAAEVTRIRLEKGVLAALEQYMTENTPENHFFAGDGLQDTWNRIKDSNEGRGAPEETLLDFDKDVAEMKRDIQIPVKHKKSGLSYIVSWLSCHQWQRATIMGTVSTSRAFRILV